MKKNALPILIVLMTYSAGVKAQVGINTTTPTATLDVAAKNATGTTTNVDGLLIPRVDRQRAQSMTSVPTSTLIYVNSITTGSQTGIAANVDAVGYYYYDGTAWIKLNPSGGNDWTLAGNIGTNAGTNTVGYPTDGNFVGTKDVQSLTLGVNNVKRGLIDTRGNMIFGGSLDPVNSPSPTTSTVASGSTLVDNFLVGSANTSNSKNGVAFGTGNVINGANTMAMAFGVNNTVGNSVSAGNRALAIGNNNVSSGSYSVAMGNTNQATANYILAQGQNNIASAAFAQALGENNTVNSIHGTAIGQLNTISATGLQGLAFGYSNNSNGNYSKTLGTFLTSGSFNDTAIGQYNAFTTGTAAGWTSTDPMFQIGIGQSAATATNAFTILKDGSTAIGAHNTKPASTLDVRGTARVSTRTGIANTLLGVASTTGQLTDVTLGSGLSLSGGTLSANAVPISNIVFPFLNIQPSANGAYTLDSTASPNYTLWVSSALPSSQCSINLPDPNTMVGRTITIIAAGGDTRVCVPTGQGLPAGNGDNASFKIIPDFKRATFQASNNFGGMWPVIAKDF